MKVYRNYGKKTKRIQQIWISMIIAYTFFGASLHLQVSASSVDHCLT
ncbi:unnamed protein product [Amoebophrya sp. A25]|nr:unnamed protein product [Amoebophrya sp. A25]|eukprot:GSA25T00015801001.1